MRKLTLIIFLLLTGCNHSAIIETRSAEMQAEIDDLLARDAENKKLELEYLEEIRIAQKNDDQEAFRYYLNEYIKVERLEIPTELKKEPNYFQGGNKVKY